MRALAFAPDGGTLAAAGSRVIGLWGVAGGRVRARLRGHRGLVWALAFSPDGRTLASGGKDGTVRLWDMAAGRETPCTDHRHELDGGKKERRLKVTETVPALTNSTRAAIASPGPRVAVLFQDPQEGERCRFSLTGQGRRGTMPGCPHALA